MAIIDEDCQGGLQALSRSWLTDARVNGIYSNDIHKADCNMQEAEAPKSAHHLISGLSFLRILSVFASRLAPALTQLQCRFTNPV